MANTYTQIYLQTVFAVSNRDCLIGNEWKDELNKYITGIVQNLKHKMLAINCASNHIHFLIGYNPNQLLPKLIQEVKANSSKWVNEGSFTKFRFQWQEGYGTFSYSRSHLDRVIQYIMNQEEHHKNITFKEEYLALLKKFDVEFDERYLFEFF